MVVHVPSLGSTLVDIDVYKSVGGAVVDFLWSRALGIVHFLKGSSYWDCCLSIMEEGGDLGVGGGRHDMFDGGEFH